MTDLFLSHIANLIYFTATLLYLGQFVTKKNFFLSAALLFTAAGFTLQVIAFFVRWKISYQIGAGHVPLASFYESLLFFSAVIAAVSMVAEIRYRNGRFGVFLLPLAFLIMTASTFVPGINNSIEPLVPALKSGWLFFHVAACIAGFAAFAATFALGILHFMMKKRNNTEAALQTNAGEIIFPQEMLLYKFSIWGFAFLTAGILSGAAWAQVAWGSYWSWDPKETCSLITWLTYALLLHLRFTGKSGKNTAAILAIIGFFWVLFTYWGTTLFSSLHSYN